MTDTPLRGTVLAAGLCAGTIALSFGPAALMLLAFPVAAVAAAGWLLVTGRHYAYLGFAATMWLVAPGVRRVVDWQSSFHEFSPINAVPAVVSLMAFPWVLRARRRLHRDVAVLFAVAVCVMAYALAVGVVLNADWLPTFKNNFNRELAKNGLWSLFAAFRNNLWLGMAVWAGICLALALRH